MCRNHIVDPRSSLVTLSICALLAVRANAGIILDIPLGAGAAFGGPGSPITRPATTYGWSFRITSPLTVAALASGMSYLLGCATTTQWDCGTVAAT
jgi:hypothetical protein